MKKITKNENSKTILTPIWAQTVATGVDRQYDHTDWQIFFILCEE